MRLPADFMFSLAVSKLYLLSNIAYFGLPRLGQRLQLSSDSQQVIARNSKTLMEVYSGHHA